MVNYCWNIDEDVAERMVSFYLDWISYIPSKYYGKMVNH